jgi:hypothetical protein
MVCIKYILIYYNGHEDSKDPSLKLVIKSLDFTLGTIHKESWKPSELAIKSLDFKQTYIYNYVQQIIEILKW